MAFVPAVVGAVSGIVADKIVGAGTKLVHDAIMSTATDGGTVPRQGMKRRRVQMNNYDRPAPRQMSHHEMTRASWTMIKDLMPRTKIVTYTMFNHYGTATGRVDAIFSGKNNLNTVGALHDRSGAGGAETRYWDQRDVIPSGFSACVRTATDNGPMLNSMIFPLSHVNLITKGDNADQRLGDFVNISGMHIYGRIRCLTFAPQYDGASPHTAYPASGDQAVLESAPRSRMLDHRRRVRFMLVEVMDTLPSVPPTAFNDEDYYGNTEWKEDPLGDGTFTQKMLIVGAPRLENILEVTGTTSIITNFEDPFEGSENGRWQKIDRKYRSNHKRDNLWNNPDEGRRLAFRVLTDVSFNLKPDSMPKRASTSLGLGGGSISKGSYVDIDMFVKINRDMSYPVAVADADLKASPDNGDSQLFWYLFDDHMDILHVSGVSDPRAVLNADYLLDETVNTGYSMCQARLRADIFFTDDL